MSSSKIIIGCDEVGRGAWAGSIVGCAYVRRGDILKSTRVGDSKALSRAQRDRAYTELIKEDAGTYCESWVSAKEIDSKGIEWANNEVLKASVTGLLSLYYDDIPDEAIEVYVDGNKPIRGLSARIRQYPIVNGDKLIYECSAASIIAKVERDRFMADKDGIYARKQGTYPGPSYYAWGSNAGYGTSQHSTAIKKYGLTELHRKTFIKGE